PPAVNARPMPSRVPATPAERRLGRRGAGGGLGVCSRRCQVPLAEGLPRGATPPCPAQAVAPPVVAPAGSPAKPSPELPAELSPVVPASPAAAPSLGTEVSPAKGGAECCDCVSIAKRWP